MTQQRYKVVETMRVCDEELERLINDAVGQGYQLESIKFVTTEASKRPGMAFLLFVGEGPRQNEAG